MFMAAVPGIDHLNIGMLSHSLDCAVPVMPNHQNIGITRNYFGGIGDTLPFRSR
jgi:hypothetical protein